MVDQLDQLDQVLPDIASDRETTWRANSRRRCAEARADWQDVTLAEIYAAGGGACHVCGRQLAAAEAGLAALRQQEERQQAELAEIAAARAGVREARRAFPAETACRK